MLPNDDEAADEIDDDDDDAEDAADVVEETDDAVAVDAVAAELWPFPIKCSTPNDAVAVPRLIAAAFVVVRPQ